MEDYGPSCGIMGQVAFHFRPVPTTGYRDLLFSVLGSRGLFPLLWVSIYGPSVGLNNCDSEASRLHGTQQEETQDPEILSRGWRALGLLS